MLPRLEAEEQLARAEAMALGSGAIERQAASRRIAQLERQAAGGAAPRVDPGTETGRAALAMMGIAVEVHHG